MNKSNNALCIPGTTSSWLVRVCARARYHRLITILSETIHAGLLTGYRSSPTGSLTSTTTGQAPCVFRPLANTPTRWHSCTGKVYISRLTPHWLINCSSCKWERNNMDWIYVFVSLKQCQLFNFSLDLCRKWVHPSFCPVHVLQILMMWASHLMDFTQGCWIFTKI